jgi:hypothetical protein
MSRPCIALSLFTCCALATQNLSAPKQGRNIRNIVLVHGAWANGSGWKGVYDILVKDGYNISIVQEPETSFKEDAAATKRTLALQDGPCILVAHSYGEPSLRKLGWIRRLSDWSTSQPTCQTLERTRWTTESDSQVTSASLAL